MVLDAINDMEHIPGKTGDKVFQRLKILFFDEYTDKEAQVLARLAMYYPKKVQRTVIQLLTESGKARIAEELKAKI